MSPARRRTLPAVALVFACVVCGACGSDDSGTQVSRSDYGDAWPLTIDSGTLHCDRDAVVLVADDGTVYALNGIARGEQYTYEGETPTDFETTIWRQDPDDPELRVSIHPLIQEGLKLCG